MSKIAEAWEKLERAFDDPWRHGLAADTVEAIHAAARALALAVLDEAEATEGRGYKHGLGRFECDLEALREEINKLGEKAND